MKKLAMTLAIIMLFSAPVSASVVPPPSKGPEQSCAAEQMISPSQTTLNKRAQQISEQRKEKVQKDCENRETELKQKQKALEEAKKKRELEEAAEKSLVKMDVPDIKDYKTWMSYTSVTSKGSPQYHLLNSEKAYTDNENFRKVGDYYCVALGSFYSTEIGTRFKITFSDGQSIKVILGDQKSDRHTDKKHQYSSSGNILEFIMGSKERSNQNTINQKFPGGVEKIEKYTNEEDIWSEGI